MWLQVHSNFYSQLVELASEWNFLTVNISIIFEFLIWILDFELSCMEDVNNRGKH